MGGKTKQVQRTKNNAKPSSSSRSAELLGTAAAATFVGFSAHSEHGLVPFAPGFATAEQITDTFDPNISPELQIILRKLTKKDPITKKKALQEFVEFIKKSDLETIKNILPIWPKFYSNLANDPEHNVRELSQSVLQLLVEQCKRAVGPYLKQLLPVWIASFFDTYAPAASVATLCFRQTFANTSNRTQEVCLHCQAEILEYTTRNLTFHTASTLSIGKSLAPEEAEQKYQRTIVSSLKSLSFFVEHTATASDQSQIQDGLQTLLAHHKFWSYAKHKVCAIKAAWFEFIYHLLQSPTLSDLINTQKSQVIPITFQNIDDAEPLIAPHVWGCLLLLQSSYEDWHSSINVRKSLLPKLSSILRNGFNRNAQAICPNILPFFAAVKQENLQDVDIYNFYEKFFDDLKHSIIIPLEPISKMDHAIITKTYFECLRFLMQKLNNIEVIAATEVTFACKMIENYLLDPIATLLNSENATVKYFFQQTSALITFWDRQKSVVDSGKTLYIELLNIFWTQIYNLVTKYLEQPEIDKQLEHVLELITDLHVANPSFEDHRVKFAEEQKSTSMNVNKDDKDLQLNESMSNATEVKAAFLQKELKDLVVQLVRICIKKIEQEKSSRYTSKVGQLTKMFSDKEFYQRLSDNGSLLKTLQDFVKLLYNINEESCEIIIGIIFEILELLDKPERFLFIEEHLLKELAQQHIQIMLLQRLLSYPLCVEPSILKLLDTQETSTIIERIAREVIVDDNKDKFNLLHKCFFQTESGNILINSKTVDAILLTVSEPLMTSDLDDMVDTCGSFIAQIMPVVCSNKTSSIEVQNIVFTRLFKFSITNTPNDYISEDTLWEITTCWQDALSSQDIRVNDDMLTECAAIIETRALSKQINIDVIDSISESTAKFITCSTEHIKNETQRLKRIDDILLVLFQCSSVNKAEKVRHLMEYCLYFEGLKCEVSVGDDFSEPNIKSVEMLSILRRTALNFTTLLKLVCRVGDSVNVRNEYNEVDDEVTEDYCDPNENILKQWSDIILKELQQCINIASAGEALIINNSNNSNDALEEIALFLSEKVKMFMSNSSEIVAVLKERLLHDATSETSASACRSLLYLVHFEQYAQFEENATILLHEDLSEQFVEQKKFKAYVNTLQYLLPKLSLKTISLSSAIMRTEPNEIWIKASVFRALIVNNFNVIDLNEKSDRNIIVSALQFITDVTERQAAQKDILLYNTEIHKQPHTNVINNVEYINLLCEVLKRFPYEFSIKHWDAIRIGLSSWILSISKSIDHCANPKTAFFVVSIYKLYASLILFIRAEKQKSSTELIKNVIDEWTCLFSREVNVVLFKSFYALSNNQNIANDYLPCYVSLLEEITPAMELIDYSCVYAFCKTSNKINLDNLCNYLLRNLSSSIHCLRMTSIHALRELTQLFVVDDIEIFDKKSDSFEQQSQTTKWHFLNRFEDYISRYSLLISKYLDEFSFKTTELEDLEAIDKSEALSFLLLWDCIIYACANSPVALRSVYTTWLNENKYEEIFLHFLFRAMPVDILKNHSAKVVSSDVFKELSWNQLKEKDLPLERYIGHLYSDVLRKLPAVVRKWWNTSPSRQKNFVDNLTTHYVSTLICNEELKAIANRKEKHENMQVTVHTSTREVLAVYAIDEARMELVITLAQNYPLGSVKVECGKQIGGRASSRNVGMQLTIFLTHQNGTIFDGLTLWKNNLDKKFEGVEECYVCYTVIHQDTCQLPKLTCKTCKKKFHGPCLYKWFTTSSKSTCPICRNVF